MKLSNGKDLRLHYEEEVDEYTVVDYRHGFRDEDGYMVLTAVKWKDAITDLDEILNTLGYKIVKKEEDE